MILATRPADALAQFDSRRAALAREVAEMTRTRTEAQGRLGEIEVIALIGGKRSDREADRLQKTIASIDVQLPGKERALAATDTNRQALARPIASAEFARIAAERDRSATEHRAVLTEETQLLARLQALDDRIRDLEYDDRAAARAQERAVEAGGLTLRPASVLTDGVLAASIPGLVAQVELALIRHSAIRSLT